MKKFSFIILILVIFISLSASTKLEPLLMKPSLSKASLPEVIGQFLNKAGSVALDLDGDGMDDHFEYVRKPGESYALLNMSNGDSLKVTDGIHFWGVSLFALELDGDGTNEIIIDSNNGGCGGFGSIDITILDCINHQGIKMETSFGYPKFEGFLFQGHFSTSDTVTITAKETGYRQTFTLPPQLVLDVNAEQDIICDSRIFAVRFQPNSMRNAYDLEVGQYISGYHWTDGIGVGVTRISFSENKATPVSQYFEPFEEKNELNFFSEEDGELIEKFIN